MELNASDERGIDVVRTTVKDFARTVSMAEAPFKILVLDEADNMTPDAQQALRRTMEMYTNTCRFILACNYFTKIIEPIQSRCALFRFRPLELAKVTSLLKRVAVEEKISLTDNGLAAVQTASEGDLRRAITLLQASAAVSKNIDENVVYEVSNLARPKDVRNMIDLALKGKFDDARKSLDVLLMDEGVSPEDLVKQIHRILYEVPIDDRVLVRIIDRIGEIDFRMTEGADPRIQIEAILAFIVAMEKG
jgi:replication factor C small subunit